MSKVAVLMGGWSPEREVSLVSGKACAEGLREGGHDVVEYDVKRDLRALERLGLFRTDPEAQRHSGLTYFMFDLKADGITVRPIAQLGGDTGFGEIFLDDVFVPDADVIGQANDGWRSAMSTSSNERGMSLRSPARFLASAERLAELWKDNGDSAFGDQVADAWIKAQAYRLHTFGTVTRLAGMST